MTTVVIVQARMASTRLPGKVMLDLAGRTVLSHVLERCRAIPGVDIVCCAVPDSPACDAVADEAERCGVVVFRGSEDDVLDRTYQAAQALHADVVLRVTSDCPLTDPEVCGQVLRLREKDGADYACNNMPPSWPHGLDCEAVTFAWLERAAREATLPSEREHVCLYIRNQPLAHKVNLVGPGGDTIQHRWTIDSPADLQFLRVLLARLPAGPESWDYRVPLAAVEADQELAAINAAEDRHHGLKKSLAEDEAMGFLCEMASRLAVFRPDGGPSSGAGHVVRCRALADALADAGWQTAFVFGEGEDGVSGFAVGAHEPFSVGGTPAQEAEALALRWPQGVDLLVVDHYDRDAMFEHACRPWARRILVLDDLANRSHDCDFLVDQSRSRGAVDYKALVPEGCRQLFGPDYALVRPEFAAARVRVLPGTVEGPVRRILVSFGAVDADNATGRVLEGIAQAGINAAVDVVLGAGAPHLEGVRLLARDMKQQVTVHIDVADMVALMVPIDLAIGAAGTTSWERCCLGIPSIVLVTADNQRGVARTLADACAAQVVSEQGLTTPAEIADILSALAADEPRRAAMAQSAAVLCDGLGTTRMLAELDPPPAKDGLPIRLRPGVIDDADVMLRWQLDPRTRRYSRNRAAPGLEEHHGWLQSRLADPNCVFNLILHGDELAGVLRLDRIYDRPLGREAFEISILVAPDHYRRGVAKAALALARRMHLRAELHAEVHAENEASRALFWSAGYVQQGDKFVNGPSAPKYDQ